MKLRVRNSLTYPLAYSLTRRRSLILLVFSFIPILGTLLLGAVAAAMASVITIERDEGANIHPDVLLERTLRAILASLVSFIYLLPAIGLLAYIGFSFFNGNRELTWPTGILLGYMLLVFSVWPLATVHAVCAGNVWQALSLPRLLWIGFKTDCVTMINILLVSMILLALKISAITLRFFGAGILLTPVKVYSEYVFQYLLADSYAGVVAPGVKR